MTVKAQTIEVSKYLPYTIVYAADKLGMDVPILGAGGCRATKEGTMEYRNGKWVKCYAISLWCPKNQYNTRGAWRIEGIRSTRYTLYGLKVGMNYSTCKNILAKKGYSYDAKTSFSVNGTYYRRFTNGTHTIGIDIVNNKCKAISYYP